MKRRLIPAIVFSVLMLAIVVAAGVHILHKEAYAMELQVKLVVTWGAFTQPYDVNVWAQQYDGDEPIGEPVNLNSNGEFTIYTGTIFDAQTSGTTIKFTWNPQDYDWGLEGEGQANLDPVAGVFVDTDFYNPTVLRVWASIQFR